MKLVDDHRLDEAQTMAGRSRKTKTIRILVGLMGALVGTAAQWALWPWVGPSRFILYYPAVILTSLLGGLEAGLVATFVSAVLAVYLFFEPAHSFDIVERGSLAPVLTFLTSGIIVAIVNEKLKRRQSELAAIELTRKSEQERLRLLDELEQERTKLKEALDARDEFLSIASHELKTPLTSLLLQVQMRRRRVERNQADAFTLPSIAAMLDSDQRQIERLDRLVDDMLDVSRINSGRLRIELEEFDLAALVREVVERYASETEKARVSISIPGACEPLVGRLDRLRIQQVLENLLTNALKYGDRTPVHVSLDRISDRVELRVRDSGRGIAKPDHERIFHRFERATRGSDKSGLGLGLYIVRNIVELHAGTVRVESEPGKGSTFIVELPLFVEGAALPRGPAKGE